jgi:hypothetical protein
MLKYITWKYESKYLPKHLNAVVWLVHYSADRQEEPGQGMQLLFVTTCIVLFEL